MRVSTNPPAHLANYEVLQHFLALKKETDHLSAAIAEGSRRRDTKAKIEYPIQMDEKDGFEMPAQLDPISDARRREIDEAERRGVSDDLIWVQNEVMKYLCADHNMTAYQTEEGVRQLATGLQAYDMSKAEVLQCINNTPMQPVELYCMLDAAEERFNDDSHETLFRIGEQIQATLLPQMPEELLPYSTHGGGQVGDLQPAYPPPPGFFASGGMADTEMNEEEFIHEAEWGKDHEAGAGEEVENDME